MLRDAPTSRQERDRCDYCDAPMAAEIVLGRANESSGPKYCCYGCRLLAESGRKPVDSSVSDSAPWFKIAIGGVIAGQAMLLDLALNLASPSGAARLLLHLVLLISCIAVFWLLGPPLMRSCAETVRQRRISIDLLFVAGIAGAFGASLYATLTDTGAVYYEVVAVLLSIYSVGRTLGARSRAQALAEARKLQVAFDTCRKLIPDGSHVECKVADTIAGDRVLILPGEPVPIDGRIESGQAFIRETPLTGEPYPVVRKPGDLVYAGSYSEDGRIVVIAMVDGGRRRLDGLVASVQEAKDRPSAIQEQADRLTRWFLPMVILASLATFVYWTIQSDWSRGLFNAMSVLIVACPCAMGLATPIAIWNAISVLASRGFVVRDPDVIGRFAGVSHLVFDKTGTLSEESLSMIDIAVTGGVEERQETLSLLKAVQAQSRHPVARAFQSWGNASPSNIEVRSVKTVPGCGIDAWVASPGKEFHIRLGERDFILVLDGEKELLAHLNCHPTDHLAYVQIDGRLRAIAAVRERLRAGAGDVLGQIKQLGMAVSVMTGDHPDRAGRLGLESVEGGLSSEDKANKIGLLRNQGVEVGFIGDGVNDAPAMNTASVGVALSHGAGIATASAGAVLYGGDLSVIPWAVQVCRRVRSSIRSNLVFAFLYNAAGIFLAATGCLHPVAAALLMVFSSFTVAWRALRATDVSGLCCAVLPGEAAKEAQKIRKLRAMASWFSSNRVQGVLLASQAPFLIYLGNLTPSWALGLLALFLVLAWGIARFRTSSEELRRHAVMTFVMLGAGNWGMILGWWADAGFAPVRPLAPCCSANADFSFLCFLNMPWMYAGMLVAGLPPMLWEPSNIRSGLTRISLGLLSALGMIYGMGFGSYAFLKLAPAGPRFLISFAGMTVGMLAGMFFCCELGRAMLLWWRARPKRRTADRVK